MVENRKYMYIIGGVVIVGTAVVCLRYCKAPAIISIFSMHANQVNINQKVADQVKLADQINPKLAEEINVKPKLF